MWPAYFVPGTDLDEAKIEQVWSLNKIRCSQVKGGPRAVSKVGTWHDKLSFAEAGAPPASDSVCGWGRGAERTKCSNRGMSVFT